MGKTADSRLIGMNGPRGVTAHWMVAVVCGKEPPAMSVSWAPPIIPIDTGFCVLFSEIDPDDDEQTDAASGVACIDCLLEDGGEQLRRGLDLARVHGLVDWDAEAEEWFVPGLRPAWIRRL